MTMEKGEIIKKIECLREELLKLNAKDTMLAETIAYCQQRQDRIRIKRREIHRKVNFLKVEISKMGL